MKADQSAEKGKHININFETFFAINQALLCVAETDGTFVRVNNAWVEALGYEIKDLEGSNFMELVHPDDHGATLGAMKDLEKGLPVLDFENRYRRKDGEYRLIEWRSIAKEGLIYATALDVTERNRATEKINLLSKALEYNPASVVMTDLEGIITYVNEKFCKMTGYTKQEVIGSNPRILKSGEQGSEFYDELWQTITSGKIWNGTFHNRKKDGSLYWEIALISPLYDNQGTITNFMAIKEDITAQKEAEERLQESKKLLDLFFQQSLDGFFFMMIDEPVEWNNSVDKEEVLDYVFNHHRVTKINQAMLDQYGASQEDFIGLTPNDFFEHAIDHGKTVWRQFFDNGTLHIDTQEQRFDGTPMIVEGDYICLYDAQGRITGHFGIQREVTFARNAKKQLEASEQRFRQLAESIDQVFFLRTETEMLYVNPAYEKVWGRSCQSLYDNPASFIESVYPEDRDKVNILYNDSMFDFNIEYRIIRPDGEVRWIWAKSFAVSIFGEAGLGDGTGFSSGSDTEGAENGQRRFAGIAQDITQRKKLEEQLRESAIRDELTGLFNRRHLNGRLEPLLEKSSRNGDLFSIALLDIDRFKSINDTYGHVAGDYVLQKLSAILQNNVRGYDLVGRYGGEEFIIAFIDIEREEAARMVERILVKIRRTTLEFDGQEIRFTFSCGVTDSQKCVSSSCSLEELINEADEELYKATHAGRNRISVSETQ